MWYLNQHPIPALPPSLWSTETMISGRQFYFSVQICLYESFFNSCVASWMSTADSAQKKMSPYKGNYNERSSNGRLKTENLMSSVRVYNFFQFS